MAGHKAQVTRAVPPWHTWGNVVTSTMRAAPFSTSAYQQIVRVAYGRPESWRFLVWAEPFGFVSPPVESTFQVTFQLMTGVGRSIVTIPTGVAVSRRQGNIGSWIDMGWTISPGNTEEPRPKWTTRAYSPRLIDGNVNYPAMNESDVIVGQDISIGCYLQVNRPDPVQVGARIGVMLAPIHHSRPDWTAAVGNFSRGELNGS